MTRATRTLRYRPELDGLRAVAVLVVVVHHVWQPARFAGFIGVHIFFVLSGYLITTILLREREQTGALSFRLFYARRLLRLYPALLLMLSVSTIGYSWLSGSLPHHMKNAIFAASYTGNVYMAYGHAWIGPFGHTWSLALEEQYYLIWPVVLLLGLRLTARPGRLAAVLVPLAIGSALLYLHEFSYTGVDFSPLSTAFGLLAGSALALVLSPGARAARAHRAFRSPAAVSSGVTLLIAALVGLSLTHAVPDGLYAPAAAVASVLIIGSCVVAESRTRVQRVLSWQPAVEIGKISYGIYLWHYPVVMSVRHFWPDASPWLVLPVALVVSVLLAAASYRFVELRFLRWKDRLHPSAERAPAMAGRLAPSEADA